MPFLVLTHGRVTQLYKLMVANVDNESPAFLFKVYIWGFVWFPSGVPPTPDYTKGYAWVASEPTQPASHPAREIRRPPGNLQPSREQPVSQGAANRMPA